MSFAFVVRTYPDIDHVVPLMWKLLESGEEVHAVVSPGYDPSKDHRLAFLRRYEGFHLHEVWPKDGPAPRGALRSTVAWALAFLKRHDVRVVSVEWGYGLADGYDDLRSLAGVKAVARSVARSIKLAPKRDPHQTRTNFVVAARLLGVPTVCLPHGLSIKLDAATNEELLRKISEGSLDWTDRNRFTTYVVNTEHHRQFHLTHAKGDPQVVQTWGAMRWTPEWFEINKGLAPQWQWPAGDANRLKVVLMVPKWKNRVKADEVLGMVKALQELPDVSVAVKGHPRPKDGSSDPLHADPAIDWNQLHDVSAVDSVALIRAADCVIDVGSSIGIEVVMQGKTLINPAYIHEQRTLFDVIPGTCVVPEDTPALVAYLHEHRAGRPFTATDEAARELLRRAVYGDSEQPFDVIETYVQRFQALSASAS